MKNKNHMIISIDADKALNKIHIFEVKTLNKVSIEGTCFNSRKTQYNKLTANIILSDERLKSFPLRSDAHPCHSYSIWY